MNKESYDKISGIKSVETNNRYMFCSKIELSNLIVDDLEYNDAAEDVVLQVNSSRIRGLGATKELFGTARVV